MQLQGAQALDEKDLEFVNALTALVSVALDRYYKTKIERAANQKEISTSSGKVKDLEIERALREDFVSLLTHDLKSPLSVIMGSAELICKKNSSPEHCLKLGGMIINQAQKVVRMINNLLDANQIRSGRKLILNIETISLNSLVNEAASELKIVHGDRFKVEADHNIEASCDVDNIKRVLENLCNNAIKYGSADSVVRIILEETNSNIQIRVHNHGNPIAPEDQKTIFQQFHRSKEATIGHSEGWGIGLTLVRGVAEAHGGSVHVESSADEGTFFIVTLPKDKSIPHH